MSRKLQKRIKNLDLKSPSVCKHVSAKLNSFCKYLDTTYDINDGGCCWTAYCLTKLLKQTGFSVSIVLYDICDIDVENIESIENSLSHYYIMIKDRNEKEYFINSAGCVDNISIIDTFSLNELKTHYEDMDWCCIYNHKKNKTIFNLLKVFYLDILYDLS